MDESSIIIAKPEMLDSLWPSVEKLLSRCVESSSGEHDLGDMKHRIEGEKCLLLGIINSRSQLHGVVTIERIDYPSGKSVIGITSAAGDGVESWIDPLWEAIEGIAKDQSCTEVRIIGRPGWARLLRSRGWGHTHTILSKKVGE